jgi:hypothetical protein
MEHVSVDTSINKHGYAIQEENRIEFRSEEGRLEDRPVVVQSELSES